jgi:hypothetical protein
VENVCNFLRGQAEGREVYVWKRGVLIITVCSSSGRFVNEALGVWVNTSRRNWRTESTHDIRPDTQPTQRRDRRADTTKHFHLGRQYPNFFVRLPERSRFGGRVRVVYPPAGDAVYASSASHHTYQKEKRSAPHFPRVGAQASAADLEEDTRPAGHIAQRDEHGRVRLLHIHGWPRSGLVVQGKHVTDRGEGGGRERLGV